MVRAQGSGREVWMGPQSVDAPISDHSVGTLGVRSHQTWPKLTQDPPPPPSLFTSGCLAQTRRISDFKRGALPSLSTGVNVGHAVGLRWYEDEGWETPQPRELGSQSLEYIINSKKDRFGDCLIRDRSISSQDDQG